MSTASRIELLYLTGCPHVDATRALVHACLEQLGLDLRVHEKEGDYPSPTLLVDGVDVMGHSGMRGRACRLDVPTEAKVLAALERVES